MVAPTNGRRSENRIQVRLPLSLIVKDHHSGTQKTHPGYTHDLSASGLTFELEEPIDLASAVDLQICPPAPLPPLLVRGWLAWEDQKKKIYGLHLSESSGDLKSLVRQLLGARGIDVRPQPDRRRGERRVEANGTPPVKLGERRRKQRRKENGLERASKSEFSVYDRRANIRVRSELPVKIKLPGHQVIEGNLASLSEHGLSFLTHEEIDQSSKVVIEIPISANKVHPFKIDLHWHFPLKTEHRYGGRFGKLSADDQRVLRGYLAEVLRDPHAVSDRRLQSTIVSQLVSFNNRQGLRMVGYHDHRAAPAYREDPLIIIPSAYAETKKDALHASYYLVTNGFQVIRYDNTNHTGESDGDILHITLTNFKEDILAALDYAQKNLGISKVGVIANSLSARTAIKAAAEDGRVSFLLGLVTAVDVRYTLHSVYCEDLVGTYRDGKLWGITNVLGCNTYLDAFLQDAIDNGFDDLQTTIDDAKRLKAPFVLLATERDPWVKFEDVTRVMAACSSEQKEFHLIPAMHQLKENPKAAQAAFRMIVSRALKYMVNRDCNPLEVIEPSMRWLAVQNRIERQRMRLFSSFEKKASHDFWSHYLDQFHFINELPDYKQLLQVVYENLHGLHPGEKVLDAGCGNGTFGLWVLTQLKWLSQKDPSTLATTVQRPIQFYCIDYVESALEQARSNHQTLQQKIAATNGKSPVAFHYKAADLEQPLPFADASFDKVCANLVISYLRDPLAAITELARITKKGGRIVLSTLKPYADTSQIYRNYVETNPGEQHIEETRKLLNNAGDIRLKETEGHFNFFSEEELKKMAKEAGLSDLQVIRAFGNQANVLIAQV